MTSDQALWAIAAMLVAVLIGAAQIYQEETKNTIGWLLGRQSILIGDARRMISGGIWTVRERLGQRRTYKVGCFNYSPLSKSTHSESGEESYEGPWPQLTRAIAQKLDIDIQISSISATGFEYPRKITHDIVVGLFRTAWREKYFHFSDPVHRIRLQGICRRDRPRITKEELIDANLGVVVQPGEVGWEYVRDEVLSAKPKHKVKYAPLSDTHEIMSLLLSGDWDVAVSDELSCLQFLEKADYAERYQIAFDWALPSYSACVAVRKGVASIDMNKLNRALREARNDPGFRELERRCLGDKYGGAVEKLSLSA